MKKQIKKWSGRFDEPVNKLVQIFTASVDFDKRLALYDIKGSLAHAEMLNKQKIITNSDFKKIEQGLNKIQNLVRNNKFIWSVDDEDVHLNIEKKLTQLIGEAGKKLHTGRSRNDQVATDMRLYLREVVDQQTGLLMKLQRVLLDIAEREADTPMPGLTHLQVAQPVTFGHHMMAWFQMLDRDRQRL